MPIRSLSRWLTLLAFLIPLTLVQSPLAAKPQVGLDEPVSMELKDADLREVLTVAARLLEARPALGSEVAGTVTVVLDSIPVGTMLDEVCRVNGCRWALETGEERVLRVSALRDESLQPISIELLDADLRETLTTFAQIAGAGSVYIAPELTGTISIQLTAVPWNQVLDALCDRAGCTWTLDSGMPRRLTVTVREDSEPAGAGGDLGRIELSSESAAVEADPAEVRVGVHLELPGGGEKSQVERFTWNQPVVAVAQSGGEERWEARLSWIALGGTTRAILPILVRCGEGEEGFAEMLEPVTLPLQERWNGKARGVSLSLFAVDRASAEAGDEVRSRPPSPSCYASRPIEVTYSRHEGSRGTSRLEGVGNYLQITATPSVDRPVEEPAFAVVLLGREGAGARVALLTEKGDGGVMLEEGWAGPDAPWKATVNAAHRIELEIHLAAEQGSTL